MKQSKVHNDSTEKTSGYFRQCRATVVEAEAAWLRANMVREGGNGRRVSQAGRSQHWLWPRIWRPLKILNKIMA